MSIFADIENALGGLMQDVADWRKAAEQLQRRERQLLADGVTNAKPHYRAGKYLYLVHPQKSGERVREYIGADPAAQLQALARVNRWAELQEVRGELARLERYARALHSNLRYSTQPLW